MKDVKRLLLPFEIFPYYHPGKITKNSLCGFSACGLAIRSEGNSVPHYFLPNNGKEAAETTENGLFESVAPKRIILRNPVR